MYAARRTYLYVVSAISLLVLATGLYNLVAVALGELADALGASVISGDSTGREQVSLAIALVAVGLPVFALHWMAIERGWRGTSAASLEDRRAALRAFHLGLVSTIALAMAVFASLQVLDQTLRTIFGAEVFADGGITNELSIVIVALPIWWFHARRRALDLRHDQLTGSAAWLTRLHRYGWAFVGLLILVTGAGGVIDSMASLAIGRYTIGTGDDFWLGPLAWSIASIVVGTAVFWIHAEDARRVIRDAAIIGEDDRATALRRAYFGAVILVALASVAMAATASLADLGRLVLGISDVAGVPDFLERVVGPLLVAIPFAVAGWAHWLAQRRESEGRSPIALAEAERLSLHLTAAVGLALLAAGTAQLLGRLFEAVVGGPGDVLLGTPDFVLSEAVSFLAAIVVGAVLWLPAWTAVVHRRAADPAAERRAPTGRAYLFLVVGVSLLAAVPSAVFTLYRLIDTMLGGRGGALGSDLAIPIAVVIVASIVGAYHGRLVAADMRTVEAPLEAPVVVAVPAGIEAVAGVGDVAAFAGATESLELVLSGPVDAVEAAVEDLRLHLPSGVSLERHVVRMEPRPT